MVLIGLIFAAAAAVWFLLLMRFGGLLAGCATIILCGCCLGHPFFHVSIVSLDRLLWGMIIAWYAFERWRHTQQQLRNDLDAWNCLDFWFIAFVAILTFSTLSHDWHYDGSQPMSRLLFLYLMPAGMYWIPRHLKITPSAARKLNFTFTIFAAYLAITALAEMSGLHFLVVPRYIVSNEFPEFLGRGRGPLLNPSANGIYLGTGLACCLSFFTAWPGKLKVPKSSRLSSWLILAAAALIAAGGGATLTRCVWLGILTSLLLIAWANLPRRQSLGATILIGTLGCAVLAASWNHLVAFKRDKNVSVADMKESAKLRPMLAAVAWQIFRDHPVRGVGYGQYKQVDQHYIAQRNIALPLDKVRPYHQHNVFLSLLTETGLLGTVPFLGLLSLWTVSSWRVWRKPNVPDDWRQTAMVYTICMVNYLANGMFQDVALIPLVNTLLFFQAGVLMSVAQQSQCVTTTASPRERLVKILQPALLVRAPQPS